MAYINYKISALKTGKLALNTPTEKLYNMLMQKLEDAGMECDNGEPPTSDCSIWQEFRELTCIIFEDGCVRYTCWDNIYANEYDISKISEDDFESPISVTTIDTAGNKKQIFATITKQDNGYVIKESNSPIFSVGEEFITPEGILGKVVEFDDHDDECRYYTYTLCAYKGLRDKEQKEFERTMNKVVWNY